MAARAQRQRHDIAEVDELLAISETFGELIAEDYGVDRRRIRVVPNAIDVEFFVPGDLPADEPATILVLGRVVVRKGVEDIVELSHRISDLEGSVRIVIVGDGSLWSDYRPLLEGLNPGTSQVVSHLSREEVRDRLQRSRLLIQASKYEPFGLTVGEALACGVPVIVTEAVGAGEQLDADVATVVGVADVDALEAAVRRELASGPLDQGRRELCRSEAIRRYSPAVVGQLAFDAASALGSAKLGVLLASLLAVALAALLRAVRTRRSRGGTIRSS